MTKVHYTIFLTLIIAFPAYAEKEISIGAGLGYMYSGAGANIALRDIHGMQYIGGGISGYSSSVGAGFGFCLGWMRTDLLNFYDDRHAFGVALQFSRRTSSSVYLSMGPTYTYFFNGISNPGFNVGVATGVSFEIEGADDFFVFPQIGYQF